MEFEIASPPLTCSTVNFGMFISMLMKPIRAAGFGLLLISSVAAQHTASHKKAAQPAPSSGLAQTPPMGWNSWDSYGLTVNEEQFRQNMVVLSAQLKEFGWQYVVVDEGWYLENPESASKPETLRYTVNPRGQYEPAPGRFPARERLGNKVVFGVVLRLRRYAS